MTRVIAGAARGRRLRVPAGSGTRPTSDRVREALFSSLESLRGSWQGCRVLDLFSGSGALGLEALSRGAAHATLVEADARAVAVIRSNVAELGLPGAVVVHRAVDRVLADSVPGGLPYDVVLADPPYDLGSDELGELLGALPSAGWLAVDAVVVVERDRRSAPVQWPDGIAAGRERRYGETMLWYGRAQRSTTTS